MANTDSAKKAKRVAERRRVINSRRKKAIKDSFKSMEKLVVAKKSKDAVAMLPAIYKAIDKAVKVGTLKKNTAARMKSRAAKQVLVVVK